jgi:hypothetical protein
MADMQQDPELAISNEGLERILGLLLEVRNILDEYRVKEVSISTGDRWSSSVTMSYTQDGL